MDSVMILIFGISQESSCLLNTWEHVHILYNCAIMSTFNQKCNIVFAQGAEEDSLYSLIQCYQHILISSSIWNVNVKKFFY